MVTAADAACGGKGVAVGNNTVGDGAGVESLLVSGSVADGVQVGGGVGMGSLSEKLLLSSSLSWTWEAASTIIEFSLS
jgi:hypothetical protein